MMPLDTFQQDILAQVLNEALQDLCDTDSIPLSTPPPDDPDDDRLRELIGKSSCPNDPRGKRSHHPATNRRPERQSRTATCAWPDEAEGCHSDNSEHSATIRAKRVPMHWRPLP
jgi:hypothetical protein